MYIKTVLTLLAICFVALMWMGRMRESDRLEGEELRQARAEALKTTGIIFVIVTLAVVLLFYQRWK